MLAVKHISFKLKCIHAFQAAEIDPVMVRYPGSLVECVNAAFSAKIVSGRFGAKLEKPQDTIIGFNVKTF